MSFKSLGLAEEIVGALEEQGYSKPTVIQQLAIPKILSGVDVIAGAQTGTGKTASFTLPLLQRLFQDQHVEPWTLETGCCSKSLKEVLSA